MESVNTTCDLREDGFNESTEVPPNITGDQVFFENVFFKNVAILVVCVLGLPGNLLVIAVYLRQHTTSTRVYMLALALADLVSCVSIMILASTPLLLSASYVFLFAADVSVGFSAMLLAFISTERLVAVRRPVAFSNAAERAKKAVVRLAVIDGVITAVFEVTRHTCCPLFSRIIVLIILCISVAVMIICYFLVTVTLVKKARTARRNVGVELAVSGTSEVREITHIDTTARTTQVTKPNSSSKHASDIPAKHYKNVYLLFTITLVFIVSWLPLWLAYAGVPISLHVQETYVVNSAINPFIYSIMSAMFRNDLWMFCRKTRSRLVNCYC